MYNEFEDYELYAHKRSDKVKWVVSFLLIFVLLAGMIGAWVMLLKPENEAPQQEAPKAKPTLSLRHKENDDLAYSGSQTTDAGNQPAKAKPRVGRNDPCPCGSGKKYKKCCGMGKV